MFHNRLTGMDVTRLITMAEGGEIDHAFRGQGVEFERGGRMV
jgi:hypothetical protein